MDWRMASAELPLFVTVGSNPARPFGGDADARARRFAENAGFETADVPSPDRPALLANLDYAWDPAWLKAIGTRPGTVLTLAGAPVLAHVPAGYPVERFAAAAERGAIDDLDGLEPLSAEDSTINYDELRKRERPFVMRLDARNTDAAERAYYDASYKGVTDALTLYLWRKPAFYLTRWAAEAGITPNMVTSVGAILCVAAFWLFWIGDYWLGIASGVIFMVLDTVDGKLARCTGSSSKWGNVFDHGIDLIHPPFWWWAWAHGLAAYGTPLEPVYQSMLIAAIVIGYVAQRLIEGMFLHRYRMHIHVWRRIDSQFRLITARRNPNMVILVAAMLFARPDVGLELVALWTILSLIFHAVRLVQANSARDRGSPVESWLTA
jgi:phosphatidylglycerophosphate synthase